MQYWAVADSRNQDAAIVLRVGATAKRVSHMLELGNGTSSKMLVSS